MSIAVSRREKKRNKKKRNKKKKRNEIFYTRLLRTGMHEEGKH